MADSRPVTGRCLCGAVRFSAESSTYEVAACHCDMCRRWSAGPFMELSCQNVRFEGEDSISRIRSSDWAERGFCNKCGSNLFYHIMESDEYQISTGLLDDQSQLHLALQVFVDRKPAFYDFAQKTKELTEAEVFAMYAPDSSP
ncbi:MAG: GFA family protein [Rhizobiales bacterium]|nr:GFA family protein [Hyphomicrobiales bacterium]MBO6700457.1 GFA family protein [Hyphomicrobiales bacterium]MBO6737993.1 GFA family protein [Hyphomicrobiales bacterium]MBO6913700.1 GFA family protein [Hyphomicrobiales bacterium]MBO6954404.1 GFA family protein [Hyphomicrobiales bacterium]